MKASSVDPDSHVSKSSGSDIASRSFYETFQVDPGDTQGRLLYTLGDGQWDIPTLRTLLEKILPERAVLDGYEVEHEFPSIGHRTMLLNARTVFTESKAQTALLLAIEISASGARTSGSWSTPVIAMAPLCPSSTRRLQPRGQSPDESDCFR